MYNKVIFEKICNIDCSFSELEEFVIDINKKEFDLENPFEKYYNVDKIISAIEKYKRKEIDAKYLSYWMDAYNWIIMGGFQITEKDQSTSLKDYLIETLIDWIDSLSFFDDCDDWYNLEEYETVFKTLDLLLQDIEQCTAIFAEYGYNEDEVVVLIRNDNAKYFIKVYGELDYHNNLISFEKADDIDLRNQVKQLINLGYQELIFNNWNYED